MQIACGSWVEEDSPLEADLWGEELPENPIEAVFKGELTDRHIVRMAFYSVHIARCYGITDPYQLDEVLFSAILHDVGKSSVPESVLRKSGPLSTEERITVEKHAAIGAEFVSVIPGWERVSDAVRSHHEWWNGSGYPDRLKGTEIPLIARIVAVADVFDALTSDRPYRKPLLVRQAINHICDEMGTHFDPEVVEAFLSVPIYQWEEYRRRAESLPSIALLDLYSW